MDIAVLDFTSGKLFIYWGVPDVSDNEKIESFLVDKGFIISSICWMCHPMLDVVEEGDE